MENKIKKKGGYLATTSWEVVSWVRGGISGDGDGEVPISSDLRVLIGWGVLPLSSCGGSLDVGLVCQMFSHRSLKGTGELVP